MAVRHMVMFVWNDDVDPSHVDAVRAALAELPAKIPEIRDYRFGPDLGINAGNAAFAVTAVFDDEAGFLTYRDHPDHQAVIASCFTGRVASRTAIQIGED